MYSSAQRSSRESFSPFSMVSLLILYALFARLVTAQSSMKVMIVGDSITHGDQGDFTWRYRISQWFSGQQVPVTFVGPWTGTKPADEWKAPTLPLYGTTESDASYKTDGQYASGVSFQSNHFSTWGRQLARTQFEIQKMVETYQPDMLLVLLGFNDAGWFVSDAQGTLNSMENFIKQARAAKPNIKFVLGNIVHRTFIGGRADLVYKTDTYNGMLKDAIPRWSTSESKIYLARVRENFSCEPEGGCPAGYDGLHPSALGEYQIAKAFSRALIDGFGIGRQELAVPANIPARPCPVPSNVVARSSPEGVTVTWDAVFGAHSYSVRTRIKGQTAWGESRSNINRIDTFWTFDGLEWEYQVSTNNGDAQSDWSPIVGAVSRPQTPAPPTNIRSTPTSDGVQMSWDQSNPANGVSRYGVILYDLDSPGSFIQTYGFTANTGVAEIKGLKAGHHYLTAVTGWNQYGGGLPAIGRTVVVARGTPPAPSNLQITSVDGTTIRYDYCGSPDAGGYRIWTRNINDQNSVSKSIDQYQTLSATTGEVYFLFPGVWNYEFCFTAVNGVFESSKSVCLVPKRPEASPPVIGGPVDNCYRGTPNTTPPQQEPAPKPTPTDANTSPQPTPTRQPSSSDPKTERFINPYLKNCDNTQTAMIEKAWKDAGTIANDHYEWVPKGSWQDAMDLYMGTDSRNDYSFLFGPGPLQQNVKRQYEAHFAWFSNPPVNTYAYIYCDERDTTGGQWEDCDPNKKDGAIAYTWDDLGYFWSNHYVVLCPMFFDDTKIPSLDAVKQRAASDQGIQTTMDYWTDTKAATLIHESYHWKDTISVPKCDLNPEIYDAQGVVDLARTNQRDAHINAESWSQAAMAIHLQKTYSLTSPPKPDGRTKAFRTLHYDALPPGRKNAASSEEEYFTPADTNGLRRLLAGQRYNSDTRCKEARYTDREQCYTIGQGRCTQNPDDHYWYSTCSGPCNNNVRYANGDECSANCFGGSCNFNAGEPGALCKCP